MTDDDKLKLSQWQTTMALFNITVDSIEECHWDDGNDNFYSVLDDLESMDQRRANPNNAMRAALITQEMGVTTGMINQYIDHLNELEAAAEELKIKQEIESNSALKKLSKKYNYRVIENPARYEKHHHFAFTTADGIPVTARMFHPKWGVVRIWFEWVNAAGKKVRIRKDTRTNSFSLPKSFPQSLTIWHGELGTMSLILTHLVVTNKLPSQFISLKPVL